MDGDRQHGSWGSGKDLFIVEENFNQKAIFDFHCEDPLRRPQTLGKAIKELTGDVGAKGLRVSSANDGEGGGEGDGDVAS